MLEIYRINNMSLEIDQSGKIENTSKNTYLALANSKIIIIKISSSEKRKLIDTIKELHRPHKTYIYQIFAVLIFILIRKAKLNEVLIDIEYQGHEASIKEVLVQLFERFRQSAPEIYFNYVGKRSSAHHAAIAAFRREKKVNIIVRAEDILKLLYSSFSNKKGWRPRSRRGNP